MAAFCLLGIACLPSLTPGLHGAVVAVYDAGLADNPAVAPDPATAAGGNWTLNNTSDASFSWGAVSPDGTTGYNAWRIRDNSAASSKFFNYSYALPSQQQAEAAANGWKLSSFFRMQDPVAGNAGTRAVYLFFGNNANTRFIAFFDILPSGALEVNFQGTGGATLVLTTDVNAAVGYNTHEILYDPATARASYRFNGVVLLTNWSGTTGAFNGVKWGTESSGGRGEAWFNKVSFEIYPPPPLPEVVEHPRSSTNAVGDTVTFSALFTNTVLNYQWFKDGTPLPGANSSSYTIPFVTISDAGDYVCRATNVTGAADTAPATLVLLPDSIPPQVAGASASVLANRIRVHFTEPVTTNSAADPVNYDFDEGAALVVSASMVDRFTVDLFPLLPPEPGMSYGLRVSGVEDESGNDIAPGTLVSLSVPTLPLMNQLVAAFDGSSAVASPLDGVTWLDRSGNENHAANKLALPGRRPVLLGGSLNGRPTLTFLRTNSQTLSIDAANGVGLGGSNHTWFFVIKPTLAGLPSRLLAHQTALNASTWGASIESGGVFSANGRNPSASSVGVTLAGVAANAWMIGEGYHEGSAGNVYIWMQNMATGVVTNGTNVTGSATGMAAPMTTWIGSANNSFYYDGEMAELLIYTNALSAAERAQVEDYLRNKYFPPPEVVQHPAPVNAVAGDAVTFTAVITNAASYLWFKDGQLIPGATNASLTLPFVSKLDEGEYVARGTNAMGYADTAPAELIVTDTTPPALVSATASVIGSRLRLHFSEPMDTNSALSLFNYTLDGGLTILSGSMPDAFSVDLVTDMPPTPGQSYTVTVSGLLDHAGLPLPDASSVSAAVPNLPVQAQLVAAFDGSSALPHPLDGVTWLDRSGNENHTINTQTETNRRPTLLTSELNGRDVLLFTKTNLQSLNIPGASSTALGGSNYTWFFVVKPTLSALPANILRHQSTFNAANWGSFIEVSGGNVSLLANGRTTAGASVSSGVVPVVTNGWMLGEGWVDGTTGFVGSRMTQPDGTVLANTNTAGTAVGFGTPIATWIGFTPGNVTHGWDGQMAEVLVYAGTLSEAQRAEIEDYLRTKYFAPPAVVMVQPPSLLNGHFHVGYQGGPGASYTIEYATNLLGPWFTLTNVVAAPDGRFDVEDTTEAPARFYRPAP